MQKTAKQKNSLIGNKNVRLWKEIKKHKSIYMIFLPTLLFYIIFLYAPMFGNVIAFQNYSITRGIFGSKFVEKFY